MSARTRTSRTPPGRASEPRLSEIAKHLVLPEGIVSTGWPSVLARTRRMGIRYDRWQNDLGTVCLAKRADGHYAASIDGIQISLCRQVGKTFTIGSMTMAAASLSPMLVLWTAHRTRTSDETFAFMKSLALRPRIRPYIAKIREGNGQQAVIFTNGSRILFGAREGGFGRGIPGVDWIIFDESQILSQKALDDMIPSANTSGNALIIRLGTPPKPTDPSEAFTSFRRQALAGDLHDGLYIEVGADDDAKPDDRRQWRKANPSYPHRTPEAAILRLRRQLGEESFRREGLGIWDPEITSRAIGAAAWNELVGPPPTGARWCAAVRFSVDGSAVALARAGRLPSSPLTHVELCTSQGVRRMNEGVGWIVDYLVKNQDRWAQIVVDGKSGAGDLVDRLRRAKIPARVIWTPNVGEVIAAHSMLDAAIRDHTLTHLDDPELEHEADVVSRRRIGVAGGFGWQAPEGMTCAGLDAVTLAHWAARTTRRRPRNDTSKRGVVLTP